MDMLPPVSSGSFSIHTHCLASVAMGEVSKLMQAASAHLHELHGVGPTVIIDILSHVMALGQTWIHWNTWCGECHLLGDWASG